MKKNFVKFLSPGTFVSEETIKEIDSWDVSQAVEMAKDIVERYDARPYAFQFFTRERDDEELDSHISAKSPLYYIGGRVLTLDEVKQEMPTEHILIANMELNRWDRVVVNDNSWRTVQPLGDDDVVLGVSLG